MKIDVQVKVNMDMGPEEIELAGGWVELEDCIKFPIKVRSYMDKEAQEKRMFVSYPQKKSGTKYEGVVYPHDKKVRQEIEERVFDAVKAQVTKGIYTPSVESVRVSLLRERQTASPVVAKGIATLQLAGMTIKDIVIKESQKGLFVQMPQYKSGSIYKDTVYGTNTGIQYLIKTEVLYAYKKEVERVQKNGLQEKQPEPRQEEQAQTSQEEPSIPAEKDAGLDGLFLACAQEDTPGMLELISRIPLQIEEAELLSDGPAVKSQFAVLEEENRCIIVGFQNNYDPKQELPTDGDLKQAVTAVFFENDSRVGQQVLMEKKSGSLKEAEENYGQMLESFRKLTSQGSVKWKEPKQQKKQPEKHVPAPGI